MKIVHAARNASDAYLLRSMLEAEGIQCMLLNEALQSASGEFGLSPLVAVQVAVIEPKDEARAADIVAEMLQAETAQGAARAPWTCEACGEENEPSFDLCWQCQAPHSA